jgi:hypothetical protein
MKKFLLTCAAAALACASHAATPSIGDRQNYTCDSYLFYNSPWSIYVAGNTSNQEGVDYQDSTLLDGTCGQGTIYWYWPRHPPVNVGVYGYDAESWGQYDGGVPKVQITPRQVGLINTLSVDYQQSYYNFKTTWNGLTEFYLLTNPSDPATKKIEVGFLTHTDPVTNTWNKNDPQLGIFTDASGLAWQAVQHVSGAGNFPYVTFSNPGLGDRPTGKLDVLGAIRWLQGKNLIQPTWWFTGIATGIEPITGAGWLRNLKFNVTYN